MDQTTKETLQKAFDEGTNSSTLISSTKPLEENLPLAKDLCEAIYRNWAVNHVVGNDIAAVRSRLGPLKTRGSDKVKKCVQEVEEILDSIEAEVSAIIIRVESEDGPVKQVINSGCTVSIEKVREYERCLKILDGWTQYCQIIERLCQTYNFSVETFKSELSNAEKQAYSGVYTDDIQKSYDRFVYDFISFKSDVIEITTIVKSKCTGDSVNEQSIKKACDTILSAVNDLKPLVTSEGSPFKYAVIGLTLLAQLAISRRDLLLGMVSTLGATGVATAYVIHLRESLELWAGLWDDMLEILRRIEGCEYKGSGAIAFAKQLIPEVNEVTETLRPFGQEDLRLWSSISSECTSETWVKARKYVLTFTGWEQIIQSYMSAIKAFANGRDFPNKRRLLLSAMSFALPEMEALEEVVASQSVSVERLSKTTITMGAYYDYAKLEFDRIRGTFDIDDETCDMKPDFSEQCKLVNSCNEKIDQLCDKLDECSSACDEMTEGEDKETCKGCCNQAKNDAQQAKSSGGGCGGNHTQAKASCNKSSCCSKSCSNVCSTIAQCLAMAFTNFLTHGFKFHQGDVIIDGNLIVTKNVLIMQNLLVLENIACIGNIMSCCSMMAGGNVTAGASMACGGSQVVGIESIVGGLPVKSQILALWAAKMDK